MAFPPPKKPKPSGPPNQGPQDPMSGMMGGGGGMPMLAMPPMGLPPMGQPGQPIDPMMAMLGGAGPGAYAEPPPPAFPPGPNGLPVGGMMPDFDSDDPTGMDQSPILAALMGSLQGGGGDPYGLPPGGPDHALDGGVADPNMGLQQLLQLLALGKMGVGGGPPMGVGAGGSGAPVGPSSTGASGLAF